LDRGAEIPRTPREERPAAVLRPQGLHPAHEPLLDLLTPPPDEAIEDDVLRVHPHVGLEGRVPVAVGVLHPEQAGLGAGGGLVEAPRQGRRGSRNGLLQHHAPPPWRSAGPPACSAMWPRWRPSGTRARSAAEFCARPTAPLAPARPRADAAPRRWSERGARGFRPR